MAKRPLAISMKFFCNSLILVLAFLILVGAMSPLALGAQVEEGRVLFQKLCASCHTVGGGKRLGPDLKGVTKIRDRDWLIRIIIAPDKMFAEKDPIAAELLKEFGNLLMPNLGLSKANANALLAYLDSESGITTEEPPQKKVVSGDPLIGKNLFTGVLPFEKGGGPCGACHNISGTDLLGGGTLGSDMTQIYKEVGDDGINSILETPSSFPTMKPIYENRPLTPGEQAHLKAFFQSTVTQQPMQMTERFIFLSLGTFLILVLLAHFLWRRRLRNVRKQLVDEVLEREATRNGLD